MSTSDKEFRHSTSIPLKKRTEIHVLFYAAYQAYNSTRATVRGVLPREVAQAVKVPTTLEATELGRVM